MSRKRYGKAPFAATRYHARQVAAQRAVRHILRAGACAGYAASLACVSASALTVGEKLVAVVESTRALSRTLRAIEERATS